MSEEKKKLAVNMIGFASGTGNNGEVLAYNIGGDLFVLAKRKKETDPWVAPEDHPFSDETQKILDDVLVGKDLALSQASEVIFSKLKPIFFKYISSYFDNFLDDISPKIIEIEKSALLAAYNKEKEFISEVGTKLPAALNLPCVEGEFSSELSTIVSKLKKLEDLVNTNWKNEIDVYKRYVKILLPKGREIEEMVKDGTPESVALDKTFKENISLFQSGISFRQVRIINENPKEEQLVKIFTSKINSIDDLVAELSK